MCLMAIGESQQPNRTEASQVRDVPETGQAGRGLAVCMKVKGCCTGLRASQ